MPVKPQYVKEAGEKIVEHYPDNISMDFEKNKQIVNNVINIDSKSVRNRIAGHVTRLKIREENQVDEFVEE